MRYCARCVYPENHPLGLIFDDEGVCSGCRVHEEKDALDWSERGHRLRELLEGYRTRSGKSYDCIVPVSGARDSYFIVHTLKNAYGMNPLLVTYNKHYNTAVGVRNLAYLKTIFGCDLLTLTVNPDTMKKITKRTLGKMGSIYWHCLAGQSVYPVQTAVRFKIPLIVWGAHQGLDQVGMFSHTDEVEMTRKYRKDHDLCGFEAEDLVGGGVTKEDVRPFVYPSDKEIEKVGVRGIYLGNYIRWDSKRQHEDMIRGHGYETARAHRTFDTYNDADCFNYSDLHDYIKFLKWGYGKASDHAAREIRLKRLTREEGIALVKKYERRAPSAKSVSLFCDWLAISKEELLREVDRFRSPSAWKKVHGAWQLVDSVTRHVADVGVGAVLLEKSETCIFKLTKPKAKVQSKGYILLGRGHVDGWKK